MDQQGEEVRLLPPTAGQLVFQCEEEERSRDGLVIGLRDRDVSQDRQWINISPREVLVLCLHLVRGDPGHIAQVLDLKGHRVQEVAGGSSFTRREVTGNCSSRAATRTGVGRGEQQQLAVLLPQRGTTCPFLSATTVDDTVGRRGYCRRHCRRYCSANKME